MKEKLELKHINPYADKALKGLFHGVEDIVTGIDYESRIIGSLNTGSVLIRDFKPLLHPLERLTHEKYFELSENNPSSVFGFWYYKNNKEAVIHFEGYSSINYMVDKIERIPHYAFEFLIKNHFDVYNLIEKGLAEPIKI